MHSLEDKKREFGDKLGERLFALEPKILRLQHDWQVYRSLFGADEERWDFLHRVGKYATVSIESSLWDSVILSLCRLTDAKSSRATPGERITLHQLSPKYVSYSETIFGREVKAAIKEAVNAVKPIRAIRDQRIAHLNQDVDIGNKAVDDVSREQIEIAVAAVSKPIILIYDLEADVHIVSGAPAGSSAGALKLVNMLYRGTTVDQSTIDRSNYPGWLMFGEWD